MADNETTTQESTSSGSGEAQTGQSNGQTTGGANNNSQQTNAKTKIADLPQDIQDYIRRLRTENEEANKKAKLESEAKEQAEATKLKEAGEFKALYEKTEGRVKELEPIQGKYDELSKLAKSRLEAEVKDWPDKLKAKLPQGEGVDVLEYARAIDNFRDLAEDYSKQQSGAGYGRNGAGPTPAGQAQPDMEKARKEASRIYESSY